MSRESAEFLAPLAPSEEGVALAALLARIRARCHEFGDCWQWQTESKARLPLLQVNGKPRSVRKMVFEAYHGPLKPGHEVKAMCDTPRCVSPVCSEQMTRLRGARVEAQRGTYTLKSASAVAAARRRGKLTMADARAIRASTDTLVVLAARYGVNKKVIWSIKHNLSWKEPTPFQGLGGR